MFKQAGIFILIWVSAVLAIGRVQGQSLLDIGAANPVPGPNDVFQLSTNGNTAANTSTGKPDGLNYYTDNSAPPGQTFTTAGNTTGLISLAIRTAGLDSGGGATNVATTPTYYLRLYSVLGSSATLLTTLTAANPGFADGDWLRWTNLAVPLAANSTYAYSFGRQPSPGGYCAMAVASGNRYSGGEMALIPTAGGSMTLGASHGYDAVFDLGLTTNLMPVLVDISAAAPTPGPNDVSQLSTNGNTTSPDGLNYYTDNAVPPGQTFTTGSNSTNLISLAVRTAGLNSGGGYGTPSTTTNYSLRIYSVSGSTATLVQSYTNNNPGFTDGDWLKWNNLSLSLAPNSTYAFSFGRLPSSGGWCALAVASGNRYSGGEMALIPVAGGTMTFGSSHGYDAVFDLGMFADAPTANTPLVSPNSTVYVGQKVFLGESALGTGTLYYQWQSGVGGSSLTNISGATSASLSATLPTTGTYGFDVIVTNSYGSQTSSVVTVTVLPPVSVTVNTSQPTAAMPFQGLGVCTAVYDGSLTDSRVAPLLSAAGIGAVRYPGGSYADIFNWETTTGVPGTSVYFNDSFSNFMNDVVTPAGAQAIVTVNYGSNPANNGGGDTNVAAAWVNYANNVKHWGVKYWEIGNEIGGNGYYGTNLDWEYDLHYPETNAATRVGQPALSPAAYGTNAVQFIQAMKAQDSTILCGVGFSPGDNSYNTPLLQAAGTNVDFVIIHWYPGSDTPSTLAASATIPSTINSTFTELTNILGATRAAQIKITVTETGAGNATGAPVALYTADNYLTWIENGVVNVDYQILHDDIIVGASETPGHAYYGAQMSHLLASVGDTFVKTTSAQTELRVHATVRQDGKTGIMLVNLDPLLTIPATVSLSGANLASSGIIYQFGLTNYNGDTPSFPVYSNTMSGLGNSFTISVPPYTIIDLLIPSVPSNTPPVLAAIGNQTVNVGQTVAFTASATDTDQPPQTLTYNLLAGPAGATLNPNSGALSWRPQVTDANTTNPFTLKVADNGSPSLSATQTFMVTVNSLTQPGLSSIGLSNGLMGFQVNGETGPDYAVQMSSNLVDWSTLYIANSPTMPFSWTDTNTAALPAQFYRIKVGPPLP
jgi:hypothetical protein